MSFMKQLTQKVKSFLLATRISVIDTVISENILLWRTTFWEYWDPLPLDQKVIMLFFASNTIALITLLEMLALRK